MSNSQQKKIHEEQLEATTVTEAAIPVENLSSDNYLSGCPQKAYDIAYGPAYFPGEPHSR
jgi:hypothetical protein